MVTLYIAFFADLLFSLCGDMNVLMYLSFSVYVIPNKCPYKEFVSSQFFHWQFKQLIFWHIGVIKTRSLQGSLLMCSISAGLVLNTDKHRFGYLAWMRMR